VKAAHRRQAHQSTTDLFDTVLGDARPPQRLPRWRAHLAAWLVALAVHLCLWLAASRTEPSLETWSARMAALIHEDLAAEAPIAVEDPPHHEPAAVPDPEPDVSRAPPRAARLAALPEPRERTRPEVPPAPSDTPTGQVAPPAESGRIIATSPVDLTDNTFVAGTASAYIGGASANDGTNRVPVPEGATDPEAPPTATPGRPSRARPVQLAGSEWRCDWPASAVQQSIYEQFVVLRVVVRADGSVEQATVMSDPGQGFGEAAVTCARRTRFTPARDARGQPIRAVSPPVRVRFTR
jgi:periplasmic protein TonB